MDAFKSIRFHPHARPTPPVSRQEMRLARSRIAGCPWTIPTNSSFQRPQRFSAPLAPGHEPPQ